MESYYKAILNGKIDEPDVDIGFFDERWFKVNFKIANKSINVEAYNDDEIPQPKEKLIKVIYKAAPDLFKDAKLYIKNHWNDLCYDDKEEYTDAIGDEIIADLFYSIIIETTTLDKRSFRIQFILNTYLFDDSHKYHKLFGDDQLIAWGIYSNDESNYCKFGPDTKLIKRF